MTTNTLNPPTIETPPGYSYMALWDMADEYLRNCEPALRRELRKAKTLDTHIDGLIHATREYAANLIEGGEEVDLAWSRAVRSALLNTEE